MVKNNNPNRDSKDMGISPRRKFPIFAVAAIGIGVVVTVLVIFLVQQQQNVQAQQSLSQIANSLTPIYPQVTIADSKISDAEGITLNEVAKTSTSETIERTADGMPRSILKDGQAELALLRGVDTAGNDIIAVTLTNTGTSEFYVGSLLITGGTSSGVETLSAYAIDDDYSPAVWGNIQKPSVTEAVLLNPGESVSAYIVGKWSVAALANEPITDFSVGAGYTYDISATEYKVANNWGISISNVRLP